MQEADLLSDEQLVGLTLEGDRDAFGQIVARCQSPICALAYSACGSVNRSEDLAQEVFVAAWRRLRELRDPAKLKSWLFAIARNLINTAFRQQSRNPLTDADPLDDALESSPECCNNPSITTISKEEEAILWQVLSGLPAIYRQPMVLFYRQEESTASVADILGISEEAVRQRLSRGRALLNERVAKVVEIGLHRSGPSKAFALTVLAALPAAGVEAGTLGTTTAAAKGSGALMGYGVLGTIGSFASVIASVAGGWIGLWGRIQNARSQRERAFARRTVWGLLAFALGFVIVSRVLFGLGVLRMSNQPFDVIACSLFWSAFLGPLVGFSIWRGRQQRRIQIEEGTAEQRPNWWMWRLESNGRGLRTATYGMLASLIFGACGWMMFIALQVEDHTTIGLLLILGVVSWLLIGRVIIHQPAKTPEVFNRVWWGLALVNLGTVNLRWDAWFGYTPAHHFFSHFAPWSVNYWILLVFVTTRMIWWLRRHFLALPDARRAAWMGIAVYLGIMIFGYALLAIVK